MTPPRSTKSGWLLFLLGCGVGLLVGFGAGVASVKAARDTFVSAFQGERSAEVDRPQGLERPAFRLQYPQNWTVDTSASAQESDGTFSIESPGQSFVMIMVADGAIEPAAAVEAQVTQHTAKLMRDATRAPFERWGAYEGVGALLTGNMLGLTPGSLRIFAFRVGERTFTVIESTFDDDRAKVAPGFALVERSFHAQGAP